MSSNNLAKVLSRSNCDVVMVQEPWTDGKKRSRKTYWDYFKDILKKKLFKTATPAFVAIIGAQIGKRGGGKHFKGYTFSRFWRQITHMQI